MFYSQFILAKKGPLGTIWIAAHLERKLRKNQVADTDIGISVDSILCPDVPIALRLSSHLLLGVVRIYNRKVNYLFDDCSEALLKVKQAFRSTAVDLPPEESKAPYHSITLPEKFDLDDFELPDSDIFQGNYVDYHISSKEQITLQDTIEGVSYSTSKFGLDERFGDGDMSGLDLEEELFTRKLDTTCDEHERMEPQISFGSTSTLKQDQHPEDRVNSSEGMVGGGDERADIMDYAQAPCTPGLEDEPNFSKVQEGSACDDHLESEYHLTGSTTRENMDKAPCEDKQEVDFCSQNDKISDTVPQGTPEENGYLLGEFEVKEQEPEGQMESIKPTSEFATDNVKESDIHDQTEIVENKERNGSVSVDESRLNDQCPIEVGLEISEGASAKNISPHDVEAPSSIIDTSNQQKSCHGEAVLASADEDGFNIGNPETQTSQGTHDSALILDTHDQGAATETVVLRPCNSVQDHSDAEKPAFSPTHDGDVKSDIFVEAAHDGDMVQATPDLPAPEKLLSVQEGHIDLHSGMMMNVSPGDFEGLDEGDAGSKTAAGRKRTFTESTLTEQSLNSAESSRQVRIKRTAGSVPDDDDLLSSILVGRNTSMLKVKPTPPPSEVTSMKRQRAASRSGAPKRKVLMDETMVLHGDAIRQQLTSTEDIRRVRKKAPCTLSEISMIRKQHMEDETFHEPVLVGISVELTSLHSHVYDLGQIKICQDEVRDASLQNVSELAVPYQNDEKGNFLETEVEYHSNFSTIGSRDMEEDERPGKTSAIDVSGQDLNDDFLTVRDNETAGPCENQLLGDKKTQEIDYTSVAVNEEWTKPTYDSYKEHMPNAAVMDSGAISNMAHASDDIIQTSCVNESEGTNACVDKDAAAVLDQREAVPSHELDFANIDHELAIDNEDKDKDGNDGETETELGVKYYISQEMTQDAAAEMIPDADLGGLEYHVQDGIYNTTSKEQLDVEFPCTGLESMLQGDSMNKCEDPDHPEAYQLHMMDEEIPGFDLHDQDELNYLAEGNDTGFLNVDDDDLTEMDDDYMPDAEDTRHNENTGWSSRTRAVSKYLQTAFIKEAEIGRNSLSLDNLLLGKSRKEASRMFFETLVLKTRDYIHVEERNPFGDITIRPRTRLMKSDF